MNLNHETNNHDSQINDSADNKSLSSRINLNTKKLHSNFDKFTFTYLKVFYQNYRVNRQTLQLFFHILSTFEDSLDEQIENDNQWSNLLSEVYPRKFRRKDKLQKTLEFLYFGDKTKFSKPIMKEQIDFVSHIQNVSKEKPYLLLAYMHVIYLGILTGGITVSKEMKKCDNLLCDLKSYSKKEKLDNCMGFFEFDVDNIKLFKNQFKENYDSLTYKAFNEEQKKEIIEESIYVYNKIYDCFTELFNHNKSKSEKKSLFSFKELLQMIAIACGVLLSYFYLKNNGFVSI